MGVLILFLCSWIRNKVFLLDLVQILKGICESIFEVSRIRMRAVINPSIHESINRSINQASNQWIKQAIKQAIRQSINCLYAVESQPRMNKSPPPNIARSRSFYPSLHTAIIDTFASFGGLKLIYLVTGWWFCQVYMDSFKVFLKKITYRKGFFGAYPNSQDSSNFQL